jgi:hypothetical protein
MSEYVAEARLENAYEYAQTPVKLTLNPITGGRSDERFEWTGMEENENLHVCVCVCVCVCVRGRGGGGGARLFFWGHMKNSCLLTFISLVYGILIVGLPMLFVHWNCFVLTFVAVEKDSIFGDLGGN